MFRTDFLVVDRISKKDYEGFPLETTWARDPEGRVVSVHAYPINEDGSPRTYAERPHSLWECEVRWTAEEAPPAEGVLKALDCGGIGIVYAKADHVVP